MKCVGIQYLEAIRKLKAQGFVPLRNVHVSFVPGELAVATTTDQSVSRAKI